MSLHLNHVILVGHLTRDPQVRTVANNKCVAGFSIAINRRYKTADGEAKEDVTFVECEAWGRTAELVGQYLVKGSACCVEGRLKTDAWDDKDGQKRSRLKVVAEHVQFMSRNKESNSQADDIDTASTTDSTATPIATNQSTTNTSAASKKNAAPYKSKLQPVGVTSSHDDPPF